MISEFITRVGAEANLVNSVAPIKAAIAKIEAMDFSEFEHRKVDAKRRKDAALYRLDKMLDDFSEREKAARKAKADMKYEAISDLCEVIGIDGALGTEIAEAISHGKIRHVKIG